MNKTERFLMLLCTFMFLVMISTSVSAFTISNQVNYTEDNKNYIFSGQVDSNSNCTLYGNWNTTDYQNAPDSYSYNGTWTNLTNIFDGDINTYGNTSTNTVLYGHLFFNYSIGKGVETAVYRTRRSEYGLVPAVSDNLYNIPVDCISEDVLQMKIAISGLWAGSDFYCFNTSDQWHTISLGTLAVKGAMFETGVDWTGNLTLPYETKITTKDTSFNFTSLYFDTEKEYIWDLYCSNDTFSLWSENNTFTPDWTAPEVTNFSRYSGDNINQIFGAMSSENGQCTLGGYIFTNDTETSWEVSENDTFFETGHEPEYAVDEDWSTYADGISTTGGSGTGFVYIYENFTIPDNVTSANWSGKYSTTAGTYGADVEVAYFYNESGWQNMNMGTYDMTPVNLSYSIPESAFAGTILQIKHRLYYKKQTVFSSSALSDRYYEGKVLWNYGETVDVTADTIFNFTEVDFFSRGTERGFTLDDWTISCIDIGSNENSTLLESFTLKNYTTVSGVTVSPAPAIITDNLTCSFTVDEDLPIVNNWTSWYVNGVYNQTADVLLSENLANGDLWACGIIVEDTEGLNSTIVMSQNLTVGDDTPPVITNIGKMLESSYYDNELANITVDCFDNASSIQSATAQIVFNGAPYDYELTSLIGDTLYRLSPLAVGSYSIENVTCYDSSGNSVTNYSGIQWDVTSAPSGETPPPTGGGGGDIIISTNKIDCDISAFPTSVVISDGSPVAEILIQNDETISYNPEYEFKDVIGSNSILDYVQITNELGTILAGSDKEFGVKYNAGLFGSIAISGQAELVLSSTRCNDIIIPITMNISDTSLLSELVTGDDPLANRISTLLSEPVSTKVTWAKMWMIIGLSGILFGTILFKQKLSKNEALNWISKGFAWTFAVSFTTGIIVSVIRTILGG